MFCPPLVRKQQIHGSFHLAMGTATRLYFEVFLNGRVNTDEVKKAESIILNIRYKEMTFVDFLVPR